MNPRVFISYSHDSADHKASVLELARALRDHGIDVELDQFHNEEIVDWPRWCNEQIASSRFVLCICTAEYKGRVEGDVPPERGKGVYWEGALLDDDIYDEKRNSRFIPVLLNNEPASSIVRILRGWTHCSITEFNLADPGYEHLLRILTGQLKTEKNPLGSIPVLPTHPAPAGLPSSRKADTTADISRIFKYAPEKLIGREDETQILNDAWAKVQNHEPGRPHILIFVALGGEGKTSLVAKWAAELANRDWPGCDGVSAWSFYSQGTRDQIAASSDLFLKEAITFFGDDADKEFAASPAGAYEKGQRLARIVGKKRNLLILDGLEPLQYPFGSTAFEPGELKDQGIAKLLKDLATTNQGLCIVTSRIGLPDLKAFKDGAVIERPLEGLSREAGVDLLKRLGVKGSDRRNLPLIDGDQRSDKVNEFEKLVENVKGHALTLTLFGGFLKRAFNGDIRKRDLVKFEKADEKIDGGHAFRTMAAYEQWLLRDGGDEGKREVAVLRLMGLFDRPADAGCLAALTSEAIPDLTEPLAGLADDDWEYCLSGLEAAKLLTVNRDASGVLISLDAHPHLREYFAKQLRENDPEALRAGHRRVYEHLCSTTQEGEHPTLEDLQPLYQAVAHGCQAGLIEETRTSVYRDRILRGNQYYSNHKLGAFGPNLGAAACFFEVPWTQLISGLSDIGIARLPNQAAFYLHALGRLTEAIEPMKLGLATDVAQGNWKGAAQAAGNLTRLELTLGELTRAVGNAEHAVTYADRSGDAFTRMTKLASHADVLHQVGRQTEALDRFYEGEQMQRERQPYFPQLYSLQGFLYCDLLLSSPEQTAWQMVLNPLLALEQSSQIDNCRIVSQRAAAALEIVLNGSRSLLDIALNHLTLGRSAFYAAILTQSEIGNQKPEIEQAVVGVRRSGQQDYLPGVLLTRAWLRALENNRAGPDSAQEDLNEAWEIAERGPMKLYMADIHLYRARLFHAINPYPWGTDPDGKPRGPKDDLAAAKKLINDCGYHRRDQELADAEAAAANW